MAWTSSLSVAVGDPTKASHYNQLETNVDYVRDLVDADHDFDVSTGDGHHNGTIHFGTALAATTIALGWWAAADGSLWLLCQTAQTGDISRGTAEFYLSLGDINDVPTS